MVCMDTLKRYEKLLCASGAAREERKDVIASLARDMDPSQSAAALAKMVEAVFAEPRVS